jgi:hypothetical protein
MQIRAHGIIGIDPGAHGAVAYVTGDNFWVQPIPGAIVPGARGPGKWRTDTRALLCILHGLAARGAHTVVRENVWGIAGQSAGGSAALGHAIGCIDMAATAAGLNLETVSPVRWKNGTGLIGKPKSDSVRVAIQMAGDDGHVFKPKRGVRTEAAAEGMAEAYLIAQWAWRNVR